MTYERHPLLDTWRMMHRRCTEPDHKSYQHYGARGITVCARWKSFEAWLEDVPPRPDGKTFGRIDNNGIYEPGNVQWETPKEQANNRTTNVFYEIDGETLTLAEWADVYGLDPTGYKRAHERIKNGWSPKNALEIPPRRGRWNPYIKPSSRSQGCSLDR